MMEHNPCITIGVPVYNEEKLLKKRLEAILNQSFKNFELIISDNASTDATKIICDEFVRKDSRIKYYRQDQNIGIINNFNFLLKNAKCPYFVWAAIDDIWDDDFIEKNIKVLELKSNIVSSTGIVKFFGGEDQSLSQSNTKTLKNIIRNIKLKSKQYVHVHPISGTFEDKARFYLRFNQGSFIYGVFRTEQLRKKIIDGPISAWDLVVLLNVLRYGDFHVIDEDLVYKRVGGLSSKTHISEYKRGEIPFLDIVFPSYSLMKWCIKNIGIKFYIKNFEWFLLLLFHGWVTMVIERKKN